MTSTESAAATALAPTTEPVATEPTEPVKPAEPAAGTTPDASKMDAVKDPEAKPLESKDEPVQAKPAMAGPENKEVCVLCPLYSRAVSDSSFYLIVLHQRAMHCESD